VAGFVEIDLVGHEGGNAIGDHAYKLTVTDTRLVGGEPLRAEQSPKVFVCSTAGDQGGVPVPILGVDSDDGSGA